MSRWVLPYAESEPKRPKIPWGAVRLLAWLSLFAALAFWAAVQAGTY